jgi:hypothetical protein
MEQLERTVLDVVGDRFMKSTQRHVPGASNISLEWGGRNLYSSSGIFMVIKKKEGRWAERTACMWEERFVQGFWWKNSERDRM